MTNLKTLLNRLIRTPEESKLQQVLLAPLGLLSFFYGWVLKARVFLYRRGIYETRSLPCKVISVGNITLGGTGKTPFVSLLAEMVRKRGYRTAILSRGYKENSRALMGLFPMENGFSSMRLSLEMNPVCWRRSSKGSRS